MLRGHTAEAVLWAFGQVRAVIETCGDNHRGRALAKTAFSGLTSMTSNVTLNTVISHMEFNSIITIVMQKI